MVQDWKTVFRLSPSPTILLDVNKLILVASKKAADLLSTSSSTLEGLNADQALCLTTEHHRWIPATDKYLDTRLNGKRFIFEVSHVPDSDPTQCMTYLTISSVTQANVKLYECVKTSDVAPLDDDAEWTALQYRMLDELPAMIVAVSVDGRHVYQNAKAHQTLGPIAIPANGIADWIRQQYTGATDPEGRLIKYTDLPIYQAAINNVATNQVEIHFGRYIYQLSGRPLYDKRGTHCGGMVFSHDVTEMIHEAAEKEKLALMQSDIKFREITNSMEQMVWVAKTDSIDYFNQRWYEYTGASAEQSLGTSWYEYLHPDDREHTQNNWLLLIESDQDRFAMQHRIRGADGQYRWFLARAISVRDEHGRVVNFLGTSTDVTQITEALEEAKTTKEQLYNIMQIAHVHYFVVSNEYIMNSAFLAGGVDGRGLYGRYTLHNLQNQDVRRLLPQNIVDSLQAVLSGRIPSATTESEVDGVWWKTQFKAMKHAATGAILGVVGTAMDINEEKIKDQKLAKASTDRLVALQNSKFKGEFLARMSHEIRTPIGGILGMVQLMKDAFHPDDKLQVFCSHDKETESAEYLESIKRCGDALLVIINDILDFSKIEVGKMDIEHNPFDLQLMVNDVYIAAKHGSNKHEGVELTLDNRVPKNLIFKGDSNRIRQILMNLMSNALKFTEKGSVICRVDLCQGDEMSEGSPEMHRVQFKVIDTGIGISRAALEKLFNPFVQADSSTARRYGGTGLGLSIARQLVKLMSGALNLESVPSPDPGHGSVATCVIPMELSSHDELAKTLPAPVVKFTGERMVLLVEDNKINQLIAQKTLQKLGLRAVLAENGQQAVDYLNNTPPEDLPSIILMDCQMPVLDGYEATMQIRRLVDSRVRTLPIVAMTASAISGDREKCLAAGMNDYVSKPVVQNILYETIRKYIDPVPGLQHAANLVTEQGTNTRPSKEAITGERYATETAGVDPHASIRQQPRVMAPCPPRGRFYKRTQSEKRKASEEIDRLEQGD